MGPYRAELTIWHSISFSVVRRNHMPIAASLPSHWLHRFHLLLRLGPQSRTPKPLILLRLCLRLVAFRASPTARTTAPTASTIACSGTYARALEASYLADLNTMRGLLETLSEGFHELHACFAMGLNLRQRIPAAGTRYSQIHMRKDAQPRYPSPKLRIKRGGIVSRFQAW